MKARGGTVKRKPSSVLCSVKGETGSARRARSCFVVLFAWFCLVAICDVVVPKYLECSLFC